LALCGEAPIRVASEMRIIPIYQCSHQISSANKNLSHLQLRKVAGYFVAAVDDRTDQLLLSDLAQGASAVVASVAEPSADTALGVALRLRDLGFVPGAHCHVVARMWPGGDPIAIRIGGSTFALRHREASCVQVRNATGRGQ
jgi:ferrous iron transport protein A